MKRLVILLTLVFLSLGGSYSCQTFCPIGMHITGNGAQSALVLDQKGYPHVAYSYSSSSSHGIKYSTWNGQSWDTQTVVSYSGEAGCLCGMGITLDSNNTPYIDFINPTDTSSIQIAHLTGSTWSITSIHSGITGYESTVSQLFIDTQGTIIFFYATDQSLECLVGQGNNWSTTTIEQSCGTNIPVVMDRTGEPHLMCWNVYIYTNGATWFTEAIFNYGMSPGIALDNNDIPYIAYRFTDNVLLAHKVNGSWETMQVENYSYTGGTGYGHLPLSKVWVLISSTNNSIIIAGNTVAKWNGTTWTYSNIPNISGSLQWAAIDGNNDLDLLYVNESKDNSCSNKFYLTLYYVFWDGTKWTTSVVN